jgi:hypothetical protein
MRSSVTKVKALLKVSPKERGLEWAHSVCTASRFVHIDVWRFCPPCEEVKTEGLPLLEKAHDELSRLLGKQGLDGGKINDYMKNDMARIKNLRDNYLMGQPSAFRPEDKATWPEEDRNVYKAV